LSFDSADSSLLGQLNKKEDWRETVNPIELLQYVDTLGKRLKQVKTAWSKLFRDIESSYRLLVADMKVIHDNVSLIHMQVGNQGASGKGTEPKTIWDAIDALATTQAELENTTENLEDTLVEKLLMDLEHHPDLQQAVDGISRLDHNLLMFDDHLTSIENLVYKHGERFKHVKTMLQHIPHVSHSDTSAKLNVMDARLTLLENSSPKYPSSSDNSGLDSLEEIVSGLKEEI
jgi:hypothetical protein